MHLQVTLSTPTGQYRATTTDISAGGILFRTDSELEVGSPVHFSIEMPVEMPIELGGGTHLVLVLCAGRVVRCSSEKLGQSVAVAIDEYRFKRVEGA